MSNRAWVVACVLVAGCFSPELPVDTDGAGDEGPSSGGSTAPTAGPGSTDPTAGPSTSGGTETTEGSTDPTDPTDPSDTDDPTDPSDTDDPTDPSDTDSSSTGGGAECGNGEVEGDEACDDGVNDGSYGGCNGDCTLGPRCGDGEQNGPEDCDDGDEVDGNGCNVNCVPSGLELWSYEEHVSPEDACVDIVAADAGHLYMVGRTDNLDGAEDADAFYVQRLSAGGNVDWTREYAPLATATEHDYDPFTATDAGDGVVVAGGHRTGTTFAFTYTDVPTVKFSAANGDVTWDRSDTFAQFAGGIVTDEDGEFVVAATTVNDFNVYLYRISPDGELLGSTDYDDGRRAQALAYDPDDVFIVGLDVQSGFQPAVLQRRNAGFGPLWEVTPAGLRSVRGVTVGDDGDVYAVGTLSASGTAWVGRFDRANGSEVWLVETNSVAALGVPSSVASIADGDVMLAGSRQNSPWIARINPEGEVLWSRTSGETGAYQAVDVGADGSIVACGTVDGGGQGDNIFVATYTP